MRPECSIDSIVRCVDDADVLVHEHRTFKFVHQSDVLVIRRSILLEQIITESVQRTDAKFRNVDRRELGSRGHDPTPIVADPVLEVECGLFGERSYKDRLGGYASGLRRIVIDEQQPKYEN